MAVSLRWTMARGAVQMILLNESPAEEVVNRDLA